MYVVTGGAGFIGSNIVKALNREGITDILVVDHLRHGDKLVNLGDCVIADYLDRDEFRDALLAGKFDASVDAVIHQGACSDTMATDGAYVMRYNYSYSKMLLHFALGHKVPLVYASSAAVYGRSKYCSEDASTETPLNVYGYSKLLFDQYVRRALPHAQSTVVGLRYFNVYGPREQHKGRMASVVWQCYRQLKESGSIRLFEGSDGYPDGEQRRDFVFVDDVVSVNLFFLGGPTNRGVFNVGTGASRSFNDVAAVLIRCHGSGTLSYVPFPPALVGKYQSFTEADLSALRATGYREPFTSLEDGIASYCTFLVSCPSDSFTKSLDLGEG